MIVLYIAVGAAAGYALGGIPFAYIIAKKTLGIDIREHGSGNVGATNLRRVAGNKLGAICFALDVLKGVLPTLCFLKSFGELVAIAAGLGAILGHVYPVWLKGAGGKGVATAAGVFLALNPVATVYAFLTFAIVGPIATRTVSAGSVAAALMLTWMMLIRESSWIVFSFTFAIAALVIYKHRSNLVRLYHGTESRVWGGVS